MKFNYFLSVLLLLFSFTSIQAQKVKIKKDLILIDKVPSFHFNKMDKGDFKSYLITSIKGDTLIEIISESVQLSKINGVLANDDHFHTYKVEFHESGKTAYFDYSIILVKKSFSKRFARAGLFSNGNYDSSKEDSFINYYNNLSGFNDIELIKKNRQKLNTDEKYSKFYGAPSTRGRRTENQYSLSATDYTITNGNIKIGAISSKKDRKSDFEQIHNYINKYNVCVATLKIDKEGKKAQLMTHYDKNNTEYIIHSEDLYDHTYNALKYLLIYGYL